MLFKINKKSGFTLIETMVGVAVFLLIATASYQAYTSLFTLVNASQSKILAINLANEQFEIARNMPYSDVGIDDGIPAGKLIHQRTINRGGIDFTVLTTVRNIDLPFDGTIGGSPNDLSPADNKMIEVEVRCNTCKNYTPIVLTTNIAPKNLETSSTNGALFIRVFDSNGAPIGDANVHIVNSQGTIIIDDVTDNNGMLQIVDAPPGSQAYEITVSKNGYSTEKTYTTSISNPSPTKPNATVSLQQVTQVSFSIDKTSSISVKSVYPNCSSVGGFDFNISGAKTIGQSPIIPKYSANLVTDGSGNKNIAGIEWDNYTINPLDSAYDLIGLNPLNQIIVSPDSSQNIFMILAQKNPKTLLISVKDNVTRLPVTEASVRLTQTSGGSFDSTKITGRGFLNQSNWQGGGDQVDFTDNSKFFSSNNNIDYGSIEGEISLKSSFGQYVSSGWLESSTFDTGSISNFHQIIWNPESEPIETGNNSVSIQIATNKTITATTTWNYKGPDGTDQTFYTVPYSNINTIHSGDRYFRYKVFLNTANNNFTPRVSDISFTFTSSCTPPGQNAFQGLLSGTYNITVTKDGYADSVTTVDINSDWKEQEVLLYTL